MYPHTTSDFGKYDAIAFIQLMTPPFVAETGVPPRQIPIYSTLPPYSACGKNTEQKTISLLPHS